MYAWFFRSLPGPLWFRVLLTVALLAVAVLALFELVFPWMEQFSPLHTEVTIAGP